MGERWRIGFYSRATKRFRWRISCSADTLRAKGSSGIIGLLLFTSNRHRLDVVEWISSNYTQHRHKRIVFARSRCHSIKIERIVQQTTAQFTLYLMKRKKKKNFLPPKKKKKKKKKKK